VHSTRANMEIEVSLVKLADDEVCGDVDIDIHRLAKVLKNNEPYTPKNPGELENFDPTKYLKVEKIRKTRKVGYVEIQLRTPVNLEEVYAKEPYSPPPPVGKGSLIVASWEGLLSRAKVSEVIDGNGMIVVEHLDYGTVSMVSWWDCHGLYKHLRHTPSRITARVPDSVPQDMLLDSVEYVKVKQVSEDELEVLYFKEVEGEMVALVRGPQNNVDEDHADDLSPQDLNKADTVARHTKEALFENNGSNLTSRLTEQHQMVHRAYLSKPKVQCRNSELETWAEVNFGPVRFIKLLDNIEHLWLDFEHESGLERLVSSKSIRFYGEELQLVSSKSFLKDDYNLSIFITQRGSLTESEICNYFKGFGKILKIRTYDAGGTVVKFSREDDKVKALSQPKHKIGATQLIVRRYGDRGSNGGGGGVGKNITKSSDMKPIISKGIERTPVTPVIVSTIPPTLTIDYSSWDVGDIPHAAIKGELPVQASHVVSPSLIYLTKKEVTVLFTRIDNLCQKLGVRGREHEGQILPGHLKLAQIPDIDDRWYRAQVISVDATQQTATVFCVDTGHTSTVDFSKIKNLGVQLLGTTARQSFSVSLDGIRPAGTSSNIWTRVSEEILKQRLSDNHTDLRAEILEEKGKGHYKANLRIQESVWKVKGGTVKEKSRDVARFLCKKGVALACRSG